MRKLAFTVLGSLVLAACSQGEPETQSIQWPTLRGEAPLVIAHRGASGERPEHTLAAYELAIEQGADVIEPDLVVTADGVLVARHDAYLSTTTDVSARPEFADRQRELFGRNDWWVFDFTLAELRTLRAVQPMDNRPDDHDGIYDIPTFEEILELVETRQEACACVIALEPEVKHPAEFAAIGLDPLPLLNAILLEHDLYAEDAPIVIQSFDPGFLIRMNAVAPIRLAMLYSGPDEPGYDMDGYPLDAVAQFASALGANKALLFDEDGNDSGLVGEAHALGLDVHVWTVRDDREPVVGESVEDELRALYALGVDGVFADFPATALAVRADMAQGMTGE
ncbi:glycerophosphodiester phosphodiesterase family protein [Hyphobacterium marinum]|uniref:glycerophosphodiester phosphodiesterase n=1 Tax=Hyphobacterium marinum TaxID=3116574 RepID=A0ABU7LWL4_9PROT|nr:glycerophosphodiester phosphodiesterase family protein [Hyphobacterium sp. Y6023]MEE2565585.1 glycerophosphodiester phosphodiesterase family protein [Hyphobacterium sp. Y6023]